jgi:hypothetical protein
MEGRMDPEKMRKISLGAIILGVILLGWDVFYTIQAASGELDSSQLLAFFGTGAIVPGVLLAVGLAFLVVGGRRARPARPGSP